MGGTNSTEKIHDVLVNMGQIVRLVQGFVKFGSNGIFLLGLPVFSIFNFFLVRLDPNSQNLQGNTEFPLVHKVEKILYVHYGNQL